MNIVSSSSSPASAACHGAVQPGRAASFLAMLALGAAAVIGAALPSRANAQVSVSVGINQPGMYGRVDIGSGPPPALIYQQPIVVVPPPVVLPRRPIYMRVPPGHEKHWDRYCSRYEACGQPVYFVRDAPRMLPPPPPRRAYYPSYRDYDRDHDHDRGHGNGKGKGHWKGNGHDKH